MVQPNHPDYPKPTSAAVTEVMKANKRTNTKPEVLIRSSLHRLGYRFRKDLAIKAENRKPRPDIVFTKKKVAVFIDGCFWHYCPQHGHIPKSNVKYWDAKLKRNAHRDSLDTKDLQRAGWTVLRIWEHTPIDKAVDEIVKSLSM